MRPTPRLVASLLLSLTGAAYQGGPAGASGGAQDLPCTLTGGRLVPAGEAFAQSIRRVHRGLTEPAVRRQVHPKYTAATLRQKIHGDVELAVVVTESGTVGDVQILRSLVPELDGQAVCAAAQWTFTPAYDAGAAVPVVATLTLEFRLH